MALDLDRVAVAAEDLRGTTQSLEEVLTPEEMNDTEFLKALDDEVFLCSSCGWWCELSEMSAAQEDSTEPECDECCPEED